MKFKKSEKAGKSSSTLNHYQKINFRISQIKGRVKRMSPYKSCILEAYSRHKKIRAIEENGLKLRIVASPILKKVDRNRCYQIEMPKPSDDSDACSVGSCSVFNLSGNNFYEADDTSSDAESCCGSGFERKTCFVLQNEEAQVSIHISELYAYRRTLEALYASGPLSWEQESMLTNLRIMLHISNDVHLMEDKFEACIICFQRLCCLSLGKDF